MTTYVGKTHTFNLNYKYTSNGGPRDSASSVLEARSPSGTVTQIAATEVTPGAYTATLTFNAVGTWKLRSTDSLTPDQIAADVLVVTVLPDPFYS